MFSQAKPLPKGTGLTYSRASEDVLVGAWLGDAVVVGGRVVASEVNMFAYWCVQMCVRTCICLRVVCVYVLYVYVYCYM